MPRIFGYGITQANTLFTAPTLLDSQFSPINLISWPLSSVSYVQLFYSLSRNGSTTTGKILIATDGTKATLSNAEAETLDGMGILFFASVSGGTLYLQYTTSASGFPATFKYYEFSWS